MWRSSQPPAQQQQQQHTSTRRATARRRARRPPPARTREGLGPAPPSPPPPRRRPGIARRPDTQASKPAVHLGTSDRSTAEAAEARRAGRAAAISTTRLVPRYESRSRTIPSRSAIKSKPIWGRRTHWLVFIAERPRPSMLWLVKLGMRITEKATPRHRVEFHGPR